MKLLSNKIVIFLTIIFIIIVALIFSYKFYQKSKVKSELNIYNWEDYIGSKTVEFFEQKYGIKVNYYTYKDEEEMFSAVQSDPSKYDLVIASSDVVQSMVAAKLLSEINFDKLPNIKNIGKRYIRLTPSDIKAYSVPYLWGTTGIVVNKKFVPNFEKSWSLMWNKSLSGKIAMLNNMDSVFASAFLLDGRSINTTVIDYIKSAGNRLIKQKPLLYGYLDTIASRDALVKEKIYIAQQYSGEAMQAVEQNPNLEYFIPKEGSPLWIDYWLIPRGSKNKSSAELFINFILDARLSGTIASELWYANANDAAREFTNPEVLSDSALYPSEEILNKCELWTEAGDPIQIEAARREMNKIWAEINIKNN